MMLHFVRQKNIRASNNSKQQLKCMHLRLRVPFISFNANAINSSDRNKIFTIIGCLSLPVFLLNFTTFVLRLFTCCFTSTKTHCQSYIRPEHQMFPRAFESNLKTISIQPKLLKKTLLLIFFSIKLLILIFGFVLWLLLITRFHLSPPKVN